MTTETTRTTESTEGNGRMSLGDITTDTISWANRAQALSVLYSHFVTSVHTLYFVTVVTVVPVVVKRKTATCCEHEKTLKSANITMCK